MRSASIDLAALARNIHSLTDALGVDQPLVDLRASAYGHGLVAVARASEAAGATALRVSSVADASVLRDAGIECDLLAAACEPSTDAATLGVRLLDDSVESRDAADSRDLGAGVYGLDPSPASPTTAVMTLSAEVIAVKTVRAGTGVSYGYTYRAPGDTAIALVSIGYADGVPRLGSNTATAALGGGIHPVVGRIAMDQLVLDIGRTTATPGDLATIFGDAADGVPTALDWALRTRRAPLALTAGLGRRVVRTHS
ncbi:MAG: alanine racemase [Microbacteriaceae bacterium]|nr:alanine racemase [Microbacteriaceae bacterium]